MQLKHNVCNRKQLNYCATFHTKFKVLGSYTIKLIGHCASSFFFCFQRMACHIQVFALTKWLGAHLPVEYYEFARGLEWSIPYLSLPWETEGIGSFTRDSTPPIVTYSDKWERGILTLFKSSPGGFRNQGNSSVYGAPLTPMEYRLFLEVWAFRGLYSILFIHFISGL